MLFIDEFISAGPYSDDPDGPRALHLLYLDGEAGLRGHFKTPSLRNVALSAPPCTRASTRPCAT